MARFAAISGGMVVGLLDAVAPPTLHVPSGLTFIDISNLPQVTTDGWRYDHDTGTFFEVDTVTQKEQFLTALQEYLTGLGKTIEQANALVNAFVDRGYDEAAADPITNADLTSYSVIVYDLGVAINLMQQIVALKTNNPAFESAISKFRTL